MAQITYTDRFAEHGADKQLRVNDCACGSGRTLLAFNQVAPGHLLYGEDLDPVATKMAAINLALHGCKGQVSNMDSLRLEWYWGFHINPYQHTMMGMPHIVRMEKSHSYTLWMWNQPSVTQREIDFPLSDKTPDPIISINGQIKMF